MERREKKKKGQWNQMLEERRNEELRKDVLRIAGVEARALEALLAELVVRLTLRGVAQHLVGGADFLELLRGLRRGVQVGLAHAALLVDQV